MEKILSISIAAYNVEKFLIQTLDSFITDKEIMDKLEVIIVSDGSTDDTVDLASGYVKRYPDTYVLIDKENGGYGSTINASLKVAKGRYFRTVDGDDWVSTDGLKELIAALERIDTDMVITKYMNVDDATMKKTLVEDGFKYDEVEKRFDSVQLDDMIPMHQTTYRTEILRKNRIKITEHCFYTDMEYNLKPIPYVNTIRFLDIPVYMYRIGREGQSVQISSWFKNINQGLKVSVNLAKYFEKVKCIDSMSEAKLRYMKDTITKSAIFKYRIMLAMPPKKAFHKMRKYDAVLKKVSPEIYENTEKQGRKKYRYTIKALRKTDFMSYPVFYAIYKADSQIKD